MVRELLMLLVHRRRVRRAEAMDILWPDKDESAANNNLRATLMHLRSLVELEANGDSDDESPPWHIRSDGDYLSLLDSDLLWIDADEFSRHIDIARSSDRARKPADALNSFRAALDLYHGPYINDAEDLDWAYHQRIGLHLDYVEAATRCSELLTAQGSAAEAASFAVAAVEAESLSEPAHRALIRALLASGDRAAAARAHRRVLEVLAADGLSPEDATVRLGAEL
jgi:DNA-binding SARP family transcriptional activator